MLKTSFFSPTKGQLSLEEVIKDIVTFIKEDPNATYNLAIGSDSHGTQDEVRIRLPDRYARFSTKKVHFVTALVIHKKGKGGRYFWQENVVSSVATLRDKIYAETLLSVNFAQDFIPHLKMALLNGEKYELEIHLDVGERGKTRDMIKEVVGIVVGNGFVAKTKPYSYGASIVADKHT